MAIVVSDNFEVRAPKPADSRYFNNMSPRATVWAANAGIPSTARHIWLTVNIAGVEFWYKSWIADIDLIQKTASPSSAKFSSWVWSPILVVTPEGIWERYMDTDWPTIYTAYWLTNQDRIS